MTATTAFPEEEPASGELEETEIENTAQLRRQNMERIKERIQTQSAEVDYHEAARLQDVMMLTGLYVGRTDELLNEQSLAKLVEKAEGRSKAYGLVRRATFGRIDPLDLEFRSEIRRLEKDITRAQEELDGVELKLEGRLTSVDVNSKDFYGSVRSQLRSESTGEESVQQQNLDGVLDMMSGRSSATGGLRNRRRELHRKAADLEREVQSYEAGINAYNEAIDETVDRLQPLYERLDQSPLDRELYDRISEMELELDEMNYERDTLQQEKEILMMDQEDAVVEKEWATADSDTSQLIRLKLRQSITYHKAQIRGFENLRRNNKRDGQLLKTSELLAKMYEHSDQAVIAVRTASAAMENGHNPLLSLDGQHAPYQGMLPSQGRVRDALDAMRANMDERRASRSSIGRYRREA